MNVALLSNVELAPSSTFKSVVAMHGITHAMFEVAKERLIRSLNRVREHSQTYEMAMYVFGNLLTHICNESELTNFFSISVKICAWCVRLLRFNMIGTCLNLFKVPCKVEPGWSRSVKWFMVACCPCHNIRKCACYWP